MGLETASYISDLNETNPLNGDPLAQGDDHIRLLKLVLKACFPTLNGALNASRVPFTATGGLIATTVQAALAELDTEKSATTHNHDSTYQAKSTNLDLFSLATPLAEVVAALDAPTLADFRAELGLAIGADIAAFAATVSEAELDAGTETALRAVSPALLRYAVQAAIDAGAMTLEGQSGALTLAGLQTHVSGNVETSLYPDMVDNQPVMSVTGTTFKEVANFRCMQGGEYLFKWYMRGGTSGDTAYFRFYVNGVAAGTQQTATLTTTPGAAKTDSLSLTAGDTVQVFLKGGSATDQAVIQNLRMSTDVAPIFQSFIPIPIGQR